MQLRLQFMAQPIHVRSTIHAAFAAIHIEVNSLTAVSRGRLAWDEFDISSAWCICVRSSDHGCSPVTHSNEFCLRQMNCPAWSLPLQCLRCEEGKGDRLRWMRWHTQKPQAFADRKIAASRTGKGMWQENRPLVTTERCIQKKEVVK